MIMKLPVLTLFVTTALLASSSAHKFKVRSMVSRDAGHRQAQAAVGIIIKLRAMNADTNQPIAALDPISGSVVIDLSTLATGNLNLEALTDGKVGSIKWEHDTVAGSVVRTENTARWAFCGNADNDFFACSELVEGFSTTVKATPYPEKFLKGTPGPSLSVSFAITRSRPKMSLTLMDANKDTLVGVLVDGTVIDLAQTPAISIRADIPSGLSVRSVRFWLDGRAFRTENAAPYAFNGNSDQDFFPFVPAVGCYNVTARAYTDRDARGTLQSTAVVNFCAIVNTSAPVTVTKAPAIVTKAPTIVTKAPAIVTKAPAIVTKAPAIVTKAPDIVTKAPAIVTKAPSIVTKAPTKSPTKAPTNAPVAVVPIVEVPFRLCAGDEVDVSGITYVADSPYVTGGTIRTVDNTADTSRIGAATSKGRFETSSADKIQYKIPIPIGKYVVALSFAEFEANAVGERVFQPIIEGVARSEIDIYSTTGGKYIAYTPEYKVTVSSGTLDIEFQVVTGFPMICAIEIFVDEEL